MFSFTYTYCTKTRVTARSGHHVAAAAAAVAEGLGRGKSGRGFIEKRQGSTHACCAGATWRLAGKPTAPDTKRCLLHAQASDMTRLRTSHRSVYQNSRGERHWQTKPANLCFFFFFFSVCNGERGTQCLSPCQVWAVHKGHCKQLYKNRKKK